MGTSQKMEAGDSVRSFLLVLSDTLSLEEQFPSRGRAQY